MAPLFFRLPDRIIMAANTPDNFFKAWFDIWEKHTAQFWEEALRSPLFLQALEQNLELSLTIQRNMLRVVDLARLSQGLPTRRDEQLICHQLNQLTTQIGRLSRRIDRLEREA